MSSTNLGDQVITYKYKHSTSEMNSLLFGILQPAIYKGGLLSSDSGIISIETFSALLNIDDSQAVTVYTTESVEFSECIIPETPYVCASYTEGSSNTYLDFEYSTYSSGTVENSICFGKALFSGSAVIDFEYTDKVSPIRNLDDNVITASKIKTKNLNVLNGVYGDDSNRYSVTSYRSPPVLENEAATTGYLYDSIPYNKLNCQSITNIVVLTANECKNNFYFFLKPTSPPIAQLRLPTVEAGLVVYFMNYLYDVTLTTDNAGQNITYQKADGTLFYYPNLTLTQYEYIKLVGVDNTKWIAEFPGRY